MEQPSKVRARAFPQPSSGSSKSTQPALASPIQLLQGQLQRALGQRASCQVLPLVTDPRLRSATGLCLPGDSPAIAILATSVQPVSMAEIQSAKVLGVPSCVRWVIDFAADELEAERRQRCAQASVADYWALSLAHCELRLYQGPNPTGYDCCRLLQAGEQMSPSVFPDINLRLQESVPLYFLTRTLNGRRDHATSALPLQVCPSR